MEKIKLPVILLDENLEDSLKEKITKVLFYLDEKNSLTDKKEIKEFKNLSSYDKELYDLGSVMNAFNVNFEVVFFDKKAYINNYKNSINKIFNKSLFAKKEIKELESQRSFQRFCLLLKASSIFSSFNNYFKYKYNEEGLQIPVLFNFGVEDFNFLNVIIDDLNKEMERKNMEVEFELISISHSKRSNNFNTNKNYYLGESEVDYTKLLKILGKAYKYVGTEITKLKETEIKSYV